MCKPNQNEASDVSHDRDDAESRNIDNMSEITEDGGSVSEVSEDDGQTTSNAGYRGAYSDNRGAEATEAPEIRRELRNQM